MESGPGVPVSRQAFPRRDGQSRHYLSAAPEALLQILHGRWRPYTEVAVREPARGWIDAVLHDAREQCLLATEIQSHLPRLEQLIRWSREKARALPSWEGYGRLGEITTSSQLLVVRSTHATRTVGREFARQLATASPLTPQMRSKP